MNFMGQEEIKNETSNAENQQMLLQPEPQEEITTQSETNEKDLNSVHYLGISIAVIAYLVFIVGMVGESGHFFNESRGPDGSKIFIYSIMTWPVLMGYIMYIMENFGKINHIRFINYPLTFLTIFILIFFCIAVFGGAVLWVMVFATPILLIAMLISFISGASKDLKQLFKK